MDVFASVVALDVFGGACNSTVRVVLTLLIQTREMTIQSRKSVTFAGVAQAGCAANRQCRWGVPWHPGGGLEWNMAVGP